MLKEAGVTQGVSSPAGMRSLTLVRSQKSMGIIFTGKPGSSPASTWQMTLASASSLDKEIAEQAQKVNGIEQAKLVGKLAAEKALAKGIEAVSFDRNGYLYHGRVKTLADAAREGGLKF